MFCVGHGILLEFLECLRLREGEANGLGGDAVDVWATLLSRKDPGIDAARFFFLQRKATAHLDFDLDLAVKQTEENPVFYVQYAHARICSIERFAEDEGISDNFDWELLREEGEYSLIRKLAQFPTVVEVSCRNLEPQRITVYLQEIASAFHSFYQKFRVVTGDADLSSARLGLCVAVRQVIHNGLSLLGVNAPERM